MKALSLLFAIILFPLIMADAISQVQPNDTDGNGRINISTLDHLRWVSENSSCWGQDFELDNDINAWDTRNWNNGAGWSPIGSSATPFTGDFDGNGYSIIGISFNNTRVWDREFNLGFFGRIQNCIIENLKINSCSFYSESNESLSNHYIGALAGSAINCTITNLSSSGSINGKLSAANSTLYLGGIVGYATNSNISFTTSSIYLTGFCNVRVIIGGLVGYNSGLYINYCSSSIIIKSGSEFGSFSRPNNVTIGGLVGINELGSLKFCHSYINNIESYGDWNAFVGGLVGKNNDSILNCYVIINKLLSDAAASIPTVASAYAGGITASNAGYISKCYSIINQMDAIAHDGLGAPEYRYIGVIAGSNYSPGTIQNCIYNTEKSGSTLYGIGIDNNNQTALARNTAEMKTDTTYINNGWDFATIWTIDSTQNDGYPSFIKIDNNAVCKLEISYPNSTNTALYKDFVLDIKTNKGDIYKRNTSLNPSYTISGFSVKDTCTIHLLNKYNDTLGIINNVPIQEGINSTQFVSLLMPYTVRLNAKDQKGNTLNQNISVKWFDASNKLLVAADSIKNVIAGKKLKYLIEPNRNFKHSLAFPDTLEYIVQNGANNITLPLDSLRLITISGTIRDAKDSSTIKKATVSISQTIGVQNSENQLVRTDSNGVFSAKIYTGSADISVSYNGYLNKSISIDTISTNRNLGNIYLSEINGATLDLSMSFTYAFKAGDSLLKNDYYTNWQDLDFAIFNVSKNKTIKDYQLQFPTFVILDTNTAINDSIIITATNRNNEFKSKSGAASVNFGESIPPISVKGYQLFR